MSSITRWMLCLGLLSLTPASSSSMMTFHQGGYNQLQIALAAQTPVPANCSQMLHQLEVSLGKIFTKSILVFLVPVGRDQNLWKSPEKDLRLEKKEKKRDLFDWQSRPAFVFNGSECLCLVDSLFFPSCPDKRSNFPHELIGFRFVFSPLFGVKMLCAQSLSFSERCEEALAAGHLSVLLEWRNYFHLSEFWAVDVLLLACSFGGLDEVEEGNLRSPAHKMH